MLHTLIIHTHKAFIRCVYKHVIWVYCQGWWWWRWCQKRWTNLTFLKERQQQSHLHCPGVLLGLGCHCSSTHFDCHWQHGSQEKPTKILTIVIHCCVLWTYTGSNLYNNFLSTLWLPLLASTASGSLGIPCYHL